MLASAGHILVVNWYGDERDRVDEGDLVDGGGGGIDETLGGPTRLVKPEALLQVIVLLLPFLMCGRWRVAHVVIIVVARRGDA